MVKREDTRMLGVWFLGRERNQQKNTGNEGHICLPIDCGKNHLVGVCERMYSTEYLAPADHRGCWSSPEVPQNDYYSSHPASKLCAKEQKSKRKMGESERAVDSKILG